MSGSTSLGTAFYRLYLLHALERGPARPGALLAALHAREGALPVPTGSFSRALQHLLDAGMVAPAPLGAVQLTPLGRGEREAQRLVWGRLIAAAGRLIAGDVPTPEPPPDGGVPTQLVPARREAEAFRERVVVSTVRQAIRRAREEEATFALVLARLFVAHPQPVRARAMTQRALRETLSRATALFGRDVEALRYGEQGVLLVVPTGAGDAAAKAELLRARLTESFAAMSTTVRAFAGARHAVRVGVMPWTAAIATSGELLRCADRTVEVAETPAAA